MLLTVIRAESVQLRLACVCVAADTDEALAIAGGDVVVDANIAWRRITLDFGTWDTS